MIPADPVRWRRISELLDRTLELPREAVPRFLEEVCAGDAALRAEVEALLVADESAGDFMEKSATELAPELLESDLGPGGDVEASLAGRRIGPWRLVREIGRGGMGTVCLAERADGAFAQTVALKLLRRGLDTDAILARFYRERQILARLEHPNIARLVDGGVTDQGLPWFAMEYADGEPITDWCAAHTASVSRKLHLFIDVCRAVRYAHHNLIVHRDLKPSNILVTEAGQPKLLDFGIAKLLAGDEDLASTVTRVEDQALTPAYAAPEQIRGDPVSTATDVYSLGVVLYEMLAGVHPHHRPGSGIGAIRRALLEEAAAPPSAIRAERGATWAGDLDNIVLMALRPEPERRYASADALLTDLESYLAGRPVVATPPSAGYRLGKFLTRHWVAVTLGGLVAVALLVGLVGTVWQARVASRERDKARAVTDFTVGLFQGSDPEGVRGDTLTALQLLDRGAERVGRELRNQPDTQAEMLEVLANVSRTAGLYDRALSFADRAVALRRKTHGGHSLERANALLVRGRVLEDQGRLADAFTDLNQCLEIRRAQLGARNLAVAEPLHDLAKTSELMNRWSAAESLYRESIVIRQRIQGPDHPDLARELTSLGIALDRGGRAGSDTLFRRALAITRRHFGTVDARTVDALDAYADHLTRSGRTPDAAGVCAELFPAARAIYGPDHWRVGRALCWMAVVEQSHGNLVPAESLFIASRQNLAAALGEAHPYTISTEDRLGWLYIEWGLPREAETWFRRAFDHCRLTFGDTNSATRWCHHNVAMALFRQGCYPEAEGIARATLAAQLSAAGRMNTHVALSSVTLGNICRATGRYAEAESLIRVAIQVERELTTGVHGSLTALGDLCREQGRLEEARQAYAEAVKLRDVSGPYPNPSVAEALVGLGRTLVLMDRAAEAEPPLRRALDIRRRLLMRDSLWIGEAQVALGACLERLGQHTEAKHLLAAGLPWAERLPPSRDPLVAEGRAMLARARLAAGPTAARTR